MLRSMAVFVPRAFAFLAILVIGVIVARLARRVVHRVLTRTGFVEAAERGGVNRLLARSRYSAPDLVAGLVWWAIILATLQLAFGLWGPNPVSDLIHAVVAWLPKAFVALVILVVVAALGAAAKDVIASVLFGLSYGRLVANSAYGFIVGVGVIAALNQIGVATSVTLPILIAVLATVAGILIVGVGGGLIRPMRQRWEGWLDRAGAESRVVREQLDAYGERRERERASASTQIVQANAGAAPATVSGRARPVDASLRTQPLPRVDLPKVDLPRVDPPRAG